VATLAAASVSELPWMLEHPGPQMAGHSGGERWKIWAAGPAPGPISRTLQPLVLWQEVDVLRIVGAAVAVSIVAFRSRAYRESPTGTQLFRPPAPLYW